MQEAKNIIFHELFLESTFCQNEVENPKSEVHGIQKAGLQQRRVGREPRREGKGDSCQQVFRGNSTG